DIHIKIFWDQVQWLTEAIVIVAFPVFAIQLTEYKLKNPGLASLIFFGIPIAFMALVVTDPSHHLIYPDPHLGTSSPFPELEYTFTTPVYLYALYVYTVNLAGIGLLLSRLYRPQKLFRSQILAIAIGFFIPVIVSVLSLFNIHITPQRDATPMTFAIGNLIVAWGLFRYHLFEVAPVARDTVVENMGDPVVVLDANNRVIDLNPATAKLLGIQPSQALGWPASEVFAEWKSLMGMFSGTLEIRTDVSKMIDGRMRHYELHISPLRDRRQRTLGRVFVLNDVTERAELQNKLQSLNEDLEHRVRERTEELAEAYDTTLEGWAKALELRDKETEGHSRRVTDLTMKLALELNIHEDDLLQIYRGAILHDIGKMAVPDEILRKAGKLNEQEWEIVHRHPMIAYELLSPIPYLKKAMDIPYCHHEKWDGSGYPRGLKGEDIPLSARIFAVADVWDAVQSDRPYNKGWPRQEATEYIRQQSGKHFDPNVVNAFIKLIEQGKI
ncbi:MAG: HD domain-containing protein, partial [Chloroflexi bacterium]|nr:HD domain-containing protein [Chloroflexota bacterium]